MLCVVLCVSLSDKVCVMLCELLWEMLCMTLSLLRNTVNNNIPKFEGLVSIGTKVMFFVF
jgi:hypothetical protein